MRVRGIVLVAALALFAAPGLGCQVAGFCLNCGDAAVRSEGGVIDTAPDLAVALDGTVSEDLSCGGGNFDTDAMNCGACGRVCSHDHAIPACAGGVCKVRQCDVGWVDLDGNPDNDCEYQCLYGGPELCDGKDNDCNGVVDDGFDVKTDPLNCGKCGNSCAYVNGTVGCIAGTCLLEGCQTGFVDLNHDPADGCEYHCPIYPPQPGEQCNGIDDNCDGQVDEPSALTAPANFCNTRLGSPCASATVACEARNGRTGWYCTYGPGVEADPNLPNGIALAETRCDGIDGDCNGQVDDTFPLLGKACDNGLLGACRDLGQVQCDPKDATKTACNLGVLPDPAPGAPSAEVCNGLDDDCDGVVDNSVGKNRVIDDMVHVMRNGNDFWIYRFEASRPDATKISAGTSSARSCSRAGALPWTQVTYAAAATACASIGFHVCTGLEWGAACAGAGAATYPYGAPYKPQACNGADNLVFGPTGGVAPSNSFPACTSSDGVVDLSGNAKEWTNDARGMTNTMPAQKIYVLRGGAYLSPALGLTCDGQLAQASADTSLADVGFRCCSGTAP